VTVPEGDTIHRTASALQGWLGGRALSAVRTTVAGLDPTPLVGRRVEAVEARGKHLLIRCSGGLTIHTHMRMAGSWHCYQAGDRWRRSERQARLELVAGDRVAVCFAAPVIELLDADLERRHPVLRRLGPDVLAPELPDPAEVVSRARQRAAVDPTVGELLLDQQVLSGIGNIYRCETLFICRLHPATPTSSLSDALLEELVATACGLMGAALTRSRSRLTPPGAAAWVYRRAGRPCRRCRTPVRHAVLGAQPRSVYWCPMCQPAPGRPAAGGRGSRP
jgi:endonuclease-8